MKQPSGHRSIGEEVQRLSQRNKFPLVSKLITEAIDLLDQHDENEGNTYPLDVVRSKLQQALIPLLP